MSKTTRILTFGMSGTVSGGIESFLLNMNGHMSDDCVFDYVIIGSECVHRKAIESKGGRIYDIASYRKNPFASTFQLMKIIRNAKKEHRVAYFNLFSMVHMVPVILCKMNGYKIVLHAHNNNIAQKGGIYRLLHNIGRRVFGGMKSMRLTNSDESAYFMFGKGKKREAQIIYNAVDVEKFRFEPQTRQSVRDELNIGSMLAVGFSGRLAAEKNPLFLIDVFEKIHNVNANTILLIAGDGNMRSAVEERIEEKGLGGSVVLLGVRKDMERVYGAMDVYVLPSMFEGLGIVLIEAQASGLPCVTSEGVVPKLAQISEDYLTYVSLNESAKKWAEVVLSLAEKKHDRAEWNDTVKQSNFNITDEAHRLEEILMSI